MKIEAYLQSSFQSQAFIYKGQSCSFASLIEKIEAIEKILIRYGVENGMIVEVIGECSPYIIALLFALIKKKCITIPLSLGSLKNQAIYQDITHPNLSIKVDENETISIKLNHPDLSNHSLLLDLQKRGHAGLILFSSGSTGIPKAIVHNWELLLEKYKKTSQARRVLAFLLFDHIGGLNTILHTLYHGGCVIVPENLSTEAVCQAIELYHAQVLPTSPTFLNLLIINKTYLKYSLSSLTLITYGTEVMPPVLLKTLGSLFPTVRLSQTYGLSELGILHVSSQDSNSLLIKLDEQSYQARVQDGMLEIKTSTAMLGYLNADNPFTEDGWFKTGDVIKQEGEYFRIMGRVSEIINVGGLKVFPIQVENVIRQMEGVEDVVVMGEKNAIVGNIVKAAVKLSTEESLLDFRKRMRVFCKEKLQDFETPQNVVLVQQFDYGDRVKKMRKIQA